jgi:hypothetical protein
MPMGTSAFLIGMVDSFKISQLVRSVRKRSWGVLILDFGWWVGEIRKAEWEIGLRPMLE